MKQRSPGGDPITIDKLFKNSASNAATTKLILAAGKSLKKGFNMQQLVDARLMVNVRRRTSKKTNSKYNDVKDYRSPEAENTLPIGDDDLPEGI